MRVCGCVGSGCVCVRVCVCVCGGGVYRCSYLYVCVRGECICDPICVCVCVCVWKGGVSVILSVCVS